MLVTLLSTLLFINNIDTVKTVDSTKKEARNLNEIVVTASRSARFLKDIPVITRVISKTDITKHSGQSLMSLLQDEIPGLEFTQTEGVTNNITFQGLGSNYILILIDGERLAGETSRSNPDFNRINLDNIEKIEIVRGGMSTLYGSGAVAGVINIITKNASSPLNITLKGDLTTDGNQKYFSGINYKTKSIEGSTNFSFRKKDEYFLPNNTTPPSIYESEGFKNINIDQKIQFNIKKIATISLKGGYYNHERFNAGDVGKIMHDIYRDKNLLIKASVDADKKSKVEISYSIDDYDKFNKYILLGKKDMNYSNTIQNPRILYLYKDGKHSLTTGLELIHEELSTYQFKNNSYYSNNSLSVYAQDDVELKDNLRLQAGLRFDYNNQYKSKISPKISILYKSGAFSYRVGYASGYRAPSLKELHTDWSHQGFFQLMGNNNLTPEKSHNFSASGEYITRSLNVSLNVYHNIITDKISTVWNNTQDTVFYRNFERATVSGADVNIRYIIDDKTSLKANYSFVKDWQTINGLNTSSVRPHILLLKIDRDFRLFKKDINISLGGRIYSAVDTYSVHQETGAAQISTYPAYSMWNIGIYGRVFEFMSIKTGIDNLFNYKPEIINFNSGISKGITFYISAGFNIECHQMRHNHSYKHKM